MAPWKPLRVLAVSRCKFPISWQPDSSHDKLKGLKLANMFSVPRWRARRRWCTSAPRCTWTTSSASFPWPSSAWPRFPLPPPPASVSPLKLFPLEAAQPPTDISPDKRLIQFDFKDPSFERLNFGEKWSSYLDNSILENSFWWLHSTESCFSPSSPRFDS